MRNKKVLATDKSVAIGGDNTGTVLNVSVATGGTANFPLQQTIESTLLGNAGSFRRKS
jgi:hypothetical protein